MRHLDIFVERGVPRAYATALIHQKRARTTRANVYAKPHVDMVTTLRGLTRLPWISGAFCRKFAGSPVCPRIPGLPPPDDKISLHAVMSAAISVSPKLRPVRSEERRVGKECRSRWS